MFKTPTFIIILFYFFLLNYDKSVAKYIWMIYDRLIIISYFWHKRSY